MPDGDGTVQISTAVTPPVETGNNGGGNGAPAPLPSLPGFMDMVPETYREKPYILDLAKNEKPFEALFTQFENAQSLIGKKTAGIEIPTENAAPEAIKAFHKALGVPDKPEEYGYKPPDYSKESEAVQNVLKELGKDDTFLKTMATKAHELGLTPKQFNALAAAVDNVTLEHVKTAAAAALKAREDQTIVQNANFTKHYGDNVNFVKRIAKETVEKVIPEEIRKTGDMELALHEMARWVYDKHFKPDTIGAAGRAAGSAEGTREQIHAQIMQLRAKPEYLNWQAPGHAALKKQVDGLYDLMHAKEE